MGLLRRTISETGVLDDHRHGRKKKRNPKGLR